MPEKDFGYTLSLMLLSGWLLHKGDCSSDR